MELISRAKCFDGFQEVYAHPSRLCQTTMKFAIYLPEVKKEKKIPVLYWLSGLTCTEQNFIQKSGAQRLASQYGYALVVCDTSPPKLNLPGEEEVYYFGRGAGFYLDATLEPWSKHYQMYSYVSQELPELIAKNFPVDENKQSIFGHSMGGHGALTIALRNPSKFRSVSAFAPICAATKCPWGEYALKRYLGNNSEDWQNYDAHLLLEKLGYDRPILIDQGEQDEFLATQLQPHLFEEVCSRKNVELLLRRHPAYDHSYYFITTFIEQHFRFHKRFLE